MTKPIKTAADYIALSKDEKEKVVLSAIRGANKDQAEFMERAKKSKTVKETSAKVKKLKGVILEDMEFGLAIGRGYKHNEVMIDALDKYLEQIIQSAYEQGRAEGKKEAIRKISDSTDIPKKFYENLF